MAERMRACSLLRAARELFDDPGTGLADSAGSAWRQGFASGGEWMRQVLAQVRGQMPGGSAAHLNWLGFVKYSLATIAAVVLVVLAFLLEHLWPLVFVVPVFYAVEAQMVFLFPLVLDGSVRPFRDARVWTRRAGGTLAVMRVVLPLAATMLFGGFLGKGFVRSWCLGCLAVCLWYENLRGDPQEVTIAAAADGASA